jgi:hypothetical protein
VPIYFVETLLSSLKEVNPVPIRRTDIAVEPSPFQQEERW